MRKITLFTPTLNIGGIESVFVSYACLLAERGYDVTYLVCAEGGELQQNISPNVRLYNLNSRRLRASLFKIVRYIKNEKPDCIIVANSVTLIVLLAKWLTKNSTRIIASHHNYVNVEIKSFLDRRLIWKLYNKCDNVIAISQGIYKLLLNKNVEACKLSLIYNPINVKHITSLSEGKIILPHNNYILFVGRLSVVKNIPLLLKAFATIITRIQDDIALVIVGDGPERFNLMKLAEEMGVSDRVYFLGATSNPYVYMKHAKELVLSSYSEAFPTVLLECLALGTTVVSTPTCGALEILDNGKYGYLTSSFEDECELADKLVHAYENPMNNEMLKDYAILRFGGNASVKQIERLI